MRRVQEASDEINQNSAMSAEINFDEQFNFNVAMKLKCSLVTSHSAEFFIALDRRLSDLRIW